jgi:hypothetical protein
MLGSNSQGLLDPKRRGKVLRWVRALETDECEGVNNAM